MRARTHVTVVGSALGTAAAVVACAPGNRVAAPNATFRLRIDTEQSIEGSAERIRREAAHLDALHTRYVAALTDATGLDAERLRAEIDGGGFLTAPEAVELGILDTVDSLHAVDERRQR